MQKNAFNSLNRSAAIYNCRVRWPRCSRFTYRGYTALVLQGMSKTDALLSKEGVMQGDPLSMQMLCELGGTQVQVLSRTQEDHSHS